jgi:hypothetical protein
VAGSVTRRQVTNAALGWKSLRVDEGELKSFAGEQREPHNQLIICHSESDIWELDLCEHTEHVRALRSPGFLG